VTESGAVYLYGISSRYESGGPPVKGVEGSDVKPVEHAGVIALTSPLHGEALAARDLRAHWRVLERAFEQGTVLPVRFGTVMESEEALRERILKPNADRLSELLREMAGLVQLNVRGQYEEEMLLRQIVRRSPAIAALRERSRSLGERSTPSAQFQLGQLVEAEVARQTVEDTEVVLRTLEPLASSARADEATYPSAFNLAFLIEEQTQRSFGEQVAAVSEQLGERIAVRCIGPLPPFSFARADLREESAAWA
jgi:gas vesicle protein GvpL/GvpF